MITNASYGTYVIDRDSPDPDLAVIVNRPGVEARDWDTQRGASTVARDNPEYPPESEVLVVVFLSDLKEFEPDWDDLDVTDFSLQTLADAGVPFYAFPRERLTEAPGSVVQETIEPTEKAEQLLEKLSQGGIDCHLEDEETIVCSKLGEQYRLQPGRLVSGSGVLAGRLDSIAKEFA